MTHPTPEYSILKTVSYDWHDPYPPKGAIKSARLSRNISFFSITLAPSLYDQFSEVRLVITDISKIRGIRIFRRCMDTAAFSDDYKPHHAPTRAIPNSGESLPDYLKASPSTCVVHLSFNDNTDLTNRRPWGSGGSLQIMGQSEFLRVDSNQHLDKPMVFKETYKYDPKAPVFIAIESNYRLLDDPWLYEAQPIVNFHFNITPPLYKPLLSGNTCAEKNSSACLLGLPTELLLYITRSYARHDFEAAFRGTWRLRESRNHTLFSLALVNRFLHSIFLPLLFSSFGGGNYTIHGGAAKLADSLQHQPTMRQYVTRFLDTEYRENTFFPDAKAYSDLFSLATSITNMEVTYSILSLAPEQLSKLEKVESLTLKNDALEFYAARNPHYIYDILWNWPSLRRLELTNSPVCIGGEGAFTGVKDRKPRFALVELGLAGGIYNLTQISSILASSTHSLQVLTLYRIWGLTNEDLHDLLLMVKQNLTTLVVDVDSRAIPSTIANGRDFAIDGPVSQMYNLTNLVIAGGVASAAVISRKRKCSHHGQADGHTEPCCILKIRGPGGPQWCFTAIAQSLKLDDVSDAGSAGAVASNMGWGEVMMAPTEYTEIERDELVELARQKGTKLTWSKK